MVSLIGGRRQVPAAVWREVGVAAAAVERGGRRVVVAIVIIAAIVAGGAQPTRYEISWLGWHALWYTSRISRCCGFAFGRCERELQIIIRFFRFVSVFSWLQQDSGRRDVCFSYFEVCK